MNVTALLIKLKHLDVRIRSVGDSLEIVDPGGTLNELLLEQIKICKPEILERLQAKNNFNLLTRATNIEEQDYYDVSHGQRRFWVTDQLQVDYSANNISVAYEFRDLEIQYLQHAITIIVERHESLRTYFVDLDGNPKQRIRPFYKINQLIEFTDISNDSNGTAQVKNIWIEASKKNFDLYKGPLLKIQVVRLNNVRFIVIFIIHHIVSDAQSLNILMAEIMVLYKKFKNKERNPLHPLKFYYKDFSAWQNGQLNDNNYNRQREYWLGQFTPPLSLLDLPFAGKRPNIKTYNGACLDFCFENNLRSQVNDFNNTHRVTLYMTLVTNLVALLHRYTYQNDIILGTSVSGRKHKAFENQVGLFLNTLALRINVAEDDSFDKLLSKVKSVVLNGEANQLYPFDQLVDELNLKRDLSRMPVFDIMVELQHRNNEDNSLLNNGSGQLNQFDTGPVVSRFDLEFIFYATKNTVGLGIAFNTDIFDKHWIESLWEHYQLLLKNSIENAAKPIKQINYLSTGEREELIFKLNKTALKLPRENKFHHLFGQTVKKFPHKIAVTCEDVSLTYTELNIKANRVAYSLKSIYQLLPGNIVVVAMNRSECFLIAILGIMKAGAAYLPIDINLPVERAKHIFTESQASLVLINTNSPNKMTEGFGGKVIDYGELINEGVVTNNSNSSNNPMSDLAYIMYTSGSTGLPKGVKVGHESLVNFLNSMKIRPGIGSEDRLLAITTFTFDISILELLLPLTVGAGLKIVSDDDVLDSSKIKNYIEKESISIMQATPTFWRTLILASWQGNKRLKILCGGEAMPAKLVEKLLDKCQSLWNMYGPTETTIWSSLKKIEANDPVVTIGKPIANTQIYILDDNQHLVPKGIDGEICISGLGLSYGYQNRHAETVDKFIKHPFLAEEKLYRTGDIGQILPNGEIKYKGRKDDQVKVRGHRVELGEIEHTLNGHENVKEALAIVQQGQDETNEIIAYVLVKEKVHFEADEIRRYMTQFLPTYMIPSYTVLLDKFPRKSSGKLDKSALPKPVIAVPKDQFIKPGNEIERHLTQVCQEVLNLDVIGVNDNFFLIGGDSVKAIQVSAKMKNANYILHVKDILNYPVLTDLAKRVTLASNYGQKLNERESGYTFRTVGKKKNWPKIEKTGKYEARFLKLPKGNNARLVENVLNELIQKYPSLRVTKNGSKENLNVYHQKTLNPNTAPSSNQFNFESMANTLLNERILLEDQLNEKSGLLIRLGLFEQKEEDCLIVLIHKTIISKTPWAKLLSVFETFARQWYQDEGLLLTIDPDLVLSEVDNNNLKLNHLLALQERFNHKVVDIYPMSPMQEGMFAYNMVNAQSIAYFTQISYEQNEQIIPELARKTITELVKRHHILRTSFINSWDLNLQIVIENREIDFFYKNLSDHTDLRAQRKIVEQHMLKDRCRPFDLENDSLIRLAIFKFQDNLYALVWGYHHITMDGWCMGILLAEYQKLYTGFQENKPVVLEERNSYRNYIKWVTHQNIDKANLYWKSYLNNFQEPTSIPKKLYNQKGDKIQFKDFVFILSKAKSERLRSFASQRNTTLSSLIQTIWSCLLGKYNQSTDVIFGNVVSGRPTEVEGIDKMIGLFINTIPLRVKWQRKSTFEDLLEEVQKSNIKTQEFHYGKLSDIQSNHALKQNLFDHILIFENLPKEEKIESYGKVKLSNVQFYDRNNYEFNFIVLPDEQIQFRVAYNNRIYEDTMTANLAQHFEYIIDQILENPKAILADIEILSNKEKNRLLSHMDNSPVDYPKTKLIHQLFEERSLKCSDKIAIALGDKMLTYNELNERSNRLAWILRDEGVIPDMVVGLLTDRSIETVVGMLAILKAGGAYLPIDTDFPEERIKYMIDNSEMKILLTTHQVNYKLKTIDIGAGHQSSFKDINPSFVNKPSDLCYVIYTSGTTGKPKGVMVEHKNVVSLLFNEKFQFNFDACDVWTMFHSHCFDFSVWEMYGALLYGGKLIVIPKMTAREPSAFLKILKQENVTVLNQTPSAFYNLINADSESEDAKLKLRYVIFGGEALNSGKLKSWHEKYPQIKLINMFGITETTVHVTFKEIRNYDIENSTSNIGMPIPTSFSYVFDKYLKFVPEGIKGELFVGGEGVSRGYLGKDDLTRERFIRNPHNLKERLYRTGDMVRLTNNGELEYFGRIDSQVQIRGFRIELEEIACQLLNHPLVKDAVVVDKNDNEYVFIAAYVVGESGLNIKDLRPYLSDILPDYMVPAYFTRIDKIPQTSNGKVNKKALPEPEIIAGHDYALPANKLETQLVELWSEILLLAPEKISVNQSFFELGGNSLKAIQVVSHILKKFERKIGIKDIFENPNIHSLARYLACSKPAESTNIYPIEECDYYDVTHSQKRLWIINKLQKNQTTYNISNAFMFKGNFDRYAFYRAFSDLIANHEILRTVFVEINGLPRQKILSNEEFAFTIDFQDLSGANNAMAQAKLGIDQLSNSIFDLQNGPLILTKLFKLEQDFFVFGFSMHHIISDAWSMAILVKEVIGKYKMYMRQGEEDITTSTIQYKDFSAWQNARLLHEAGNKHALYWKRKLAKIYEPLKLPFDFKSEYNLPSGADRVYLKLNEEITNKMRQLATNQESTLYFQLLSLLYILVHRYSGQYDIVISSPVAGRTHEDLENQIGFYVNTLPLRMEINSRLSFINFLKQVALNTLEALEHQIYPLDLLIDNLSDQPPQNFKSLIDFGFTWQEGKDPAPNVDFQIETLDTVIDGLKAPLWFYGTEYNNHIIFTIEFNKALFNKDAIQLMADRFLKLIETCLGDPDIQIENISLNSIEHFVNSVDVDAFDESFGLNL